MNITLHSTLGLKEAIDGKDIEMLAPDGTTVRGFLVRIVERWGDRLSPHLLELGRDHPLYLADGERSDHAVLSGMETIHKDGNEVLFSILLQERKT